MALRALARVNLAAIERNVARLRTGLVGDARLCAVVKADASGHGAVEVARVALAAGAASRRGARGAGGGGAGAASVAVATAREAVVLRDAGISAPVLVLGAVSAEELPVALAALTELTAWTGGFVAEVQACATEVVRIHVKFDTGMGRLGTRSVPEALAIADFGSAGPPEVQPAGGMDHFGDAVGDERFMAAQLAAFIPFADAMRR